MNATMRGQRPQREISSSRNSLRDIFRVEQPVTMIAEHTTHDGTQYILDSAKPDFAFVVVSPSGVETVTYFDYAEVHDDCIGLYRRGGEEFVGEITDGLKHSSIRSAMKAIESCQLDP